MFELSQDPGKYASLFFEELPKKPFCSYGKGEVMQIRSKKTAVARPLIQFNKPTDVSWLCFDIDRPLAHEAYFHANLPTPTLIVINPKNGHCHAYWAIDKPVHRQDCASFKVLRYLAAVEEGMRIKLEADAGFAGLLGKTPFHADWRTLESSVHASYSLGYLAEFVDLPKIMPKRLGIRTGLGRNIELFDRLRGFAYKWKADYIAAKKTREQWNSAILSYAIELNIFITPLPYSEVKAVAKSVAKWTWQHYTGKMSDADFSSIQSKRGKRPRLKNQKINVIKVETINNECN